jgi:hypothetical protein
MKLPQLITDPPLCCIIGVCIIGVCIVPAIAILKHIINP